MITEENMMGIDKKTTVGFTVADGKTDEYLKFKEINKDDFFGAAIIRCAEKWGCLMEKRIADGLSLPQAAEVTQFDSGLYGITGYMYGAVVNTLANFWKYGEQLRVWHNNKYHYGSEGVVNSAILIMPEQTDEIGETDIQPELKM